MTKGEFDIVVSMYTELHALAGGLYCDHDVGVCCCGVYDTLSKAKKAIEVSARRHGYLVKKGKK